MWSATQPRVLLQLAALYAMGLPIAALSHAALSLFPPGGLYNRPLSPSNVLVTERHAWDAPLKAPKWIGMSGTHLPQVQPTDATPHPQEPPYPTLHSRQVPPSRDALLVVDVRCLTEPRLATSAKSQGWAVMPLFLGGAVASGVYRLPMYAGPPTKDALQQIAAECSAEAKGWAGGVELLLKRKLLKLVEGASVTVFLLDAQRFGEWEEEEVTCQQQGGRSRTSAALASLLVSLPPTPSPLGLPLVPPTSCRLPFHVAVPSARRRLFPQGRQGQAHRRQAGENTEIALLTLVGGRGAGRLRGGGEQGDGGGIRHPRSAFQVNHVGRALYLDYCVAA